SPGAQRGADPPAAGDSSAVYSARGGTRRSHGVSRKFRRTVSQWGRGVLQPSDRAMEQYQDAGYGSQRGSDPWGTLRQGPAAPAGESPGFLCPFHLRIPRDRNVSQASFGVRLSKYCGTWGKRLTQYFSWTASAILRALVLQRDVGCRGRGGADASDQTANHDRFVAPVPGCLLDSWCC